MKHCPACFLNFHDKFDSCFKCSGKLADGDVPETRRGGAPVAEPAEGAATEELARERLKYGSYAVAAVAVLFVALGAYRWATDPTLPIREQYAWLHDDLDEHTLVPSGGVLRGEADRASLAETTGLTMAAPGPGEALVYYPLGVPGGRLPPFDLRIVDVRRGDGGAFATIGRAQERTSAFEAVLQAMSLRPTAMGPGSALQLVVAARVPAFEGTVSFGSASGTPAATAFDAEALSQEVAYEATMGWWQDFSTLASLGLVGLIAFVWLTIKLS